MKAKIETLYLKGLRFLKQMVDLSSLIASLHHNGLPSSSSFIKTTKQAQQSSIEASVQEGKDLNEQRLPNEATLEVRVLKQVSNMGAQGFDPSVATTSCLYICHAVNDQDDTSNFNMWSRRGGSPSPHRGQSKLPKLSFMQ